MLATLMAETRPTFDRDKATREELRQLSKQQFSIPYVARQIDITPAYLRQLLLGEKNPSIQIVHKLEKFFAVDHGTLCPGGDNYSRTAATHDLESLRALRSRRGLDDALRLTRIKSDRGYQLVQTIIQLVREVEATEGAVDGRSVDVVEATLALIQDLLRRGLSLSEASDQVVLYQLLTARPELVHTLRTFDVGDLTDPAAVLRRLADADHTVPATDVVIPPPSPR